MSYLKINISSEIGMMLRPNDCWIGYRRSIWSHLLVKHRLIRTRANQNLRLYYAEGVELEMDYEVWLDPYVRVRADLLRWIDITTVRTGGRGPRPARCSTSGRSPS